MDPNPLPFDTPVPIVREGGERIATITIPGHLFGYDAEPGYRVPCDVLSLFDYRMRWDGERLIAPDDRVLDLPLVERV